MLENTSDSLQIYPSLSLIRDGKDTMLENSISNTHIVMEKQEREKTYPTLSWKSKGERRLQR
jgi:hypothetical protein